MPNPSINDNVQQQQPPMRMRRERAIRRGEHMDNYLDALNQEEIERRQRDSERRNRRGGRSRRGGRKSTKKNKSKKRCVGKNKADCYYSPHCMWACGSDRRYCRTKKNKPSKTRRSKSKKSTTRKSKSRR